MNREARLLNLFTKEHSFHIRLIFEGLIIGVCTGMVTGFLRYMVARSEELRPMVYELVRNDSRLIVPYILCFVLIAFILSWIIKKEPMCASSGIPQMKGILIGKLHLNWIRVLIGKLIGCILAVGSGMSLGRQGPSIALGACVGQGISRLGKRTRYEERILISAGASAGLAGAFNAPLAGLIYAIEDVQKSFSPFVMLTAMVAAVNATTVDRLLFGENAIFILGNFCHWDLQMYIIIMALGAFVGMLGRTFADSMTLTLDTFDRLGIKGMRRILLPLAAVAGIGFVMPELLGGSERTVGMLFDAQLSLILLAAIYIGKHLLTMLCFGSTAPGGLFLPMLVLGASSGAFFGKLMIMAGFLPTEYLGDMVLFGMAAYFAAASKTPVTASVLIMELTGSYHHLLALICVSMTAYIVSDLLGGKPVFDQLLARTLFLQGKLKSVSDKKRTAMEVTVAYGSQLSHKLIGNISWPGNTAIISIKRGIERITPEDSTLLQPGDFIYLVTENRYISELQEMAADPQIKDRSIR